MSAEQLYLILIIILFILAITDLVVGVSNDAVNFLVAAYGSKSGPMWLILLVASLGVFVGAVFSNGMMEVARKGIFNPQMFTFSQIILIFVAVMLTDIILLDFFNTFGFPTSTTVSLVFELLGAAVAISLYAISQTHNGNLAQYINASRSLLIISGILLSIVVAFIVGAFVQFFARLLFTFEYEKNYKYFGSLWGGFSFAVITYFMFIKGFKNSAFSDAAWVQWALAHKGLILGVIFIGSTAIFEILKSIFNIDILKIVVLTGTFALAMAFAGNDLVNFIGVPLAGYSSFQFWVHSHVPPDQYTMEALAGKVHVSPLFLIGAGLIMILTLWFSRKARTVIETSVNLARQDTGYERFGASPISRSIVRATINFANLLNQITPKRVRIWIEKRFELKNRKPQNNDSAFDLIRASVNLVVASALIALATSYKLPLSTTYVTFMVAMGTSLADRAWGRESAVYRVTGVISVIGGWFLTALIAFTIALTIGFIIAYFKGYAIATLIVVDIFLIYHSRIIHRRRQEKEQEQKQFFALDKDINEENVFDKAKTTILRELIKVKDILELVKDGLINTDRRKLKNAVQIAESLKDNSKYIKKNIYRIIQALREDMINAAQFYVQAVDHLREIANAAVYLTRRVHEHVENNHAPFNHAQKKDFLEIWEIVYQFVQKVINVMENNDIQEIEKIRAWKNDILGIFEEKKEAEIKRIQQAQVDPTTSNLLLNSLVEFKNLILFFNRILKAYKRFYTYKALLKTNVVPMT